MEAQTTYALVTPARHNPCRGTSGGGGDVEVQQYFTTLPTSRSGEFDLSELDWV